MFGRSRRERRFTKVALEAQAEWASLSEVDKRPLRDAFDAGPPAAHRLGFGSRHARSRAASVVRNLPARAARPAVTLPSDGGDDTMVVSSVPAWQLYKRTAAFVCEPDRALRPVRFIAFNVDGQLQREVPRVIAVRDRVPFTSAEQRRLMTSGTDLDLRLADVIATARRFGFDGTVHQVYLLTAPFQGGHVSLPGPVSWRSGLRRLLSPAQPAEIDRTSLQRLRVTT